MNNLAPTEVDILANLLLGEADRQPSLPPADGGTPREALAMAMLPALQKRPCFVSFSGGRDSSAVLAVAVEVAREHGLPDPIPATLRFPGAPQTDETGWQQIVVEHLGLREHVIVDIDDELDALGDIATTILLRDGLRWPANAYMHVPLFERARGGALLTGVGGDELLASKAAGWVFAAHRRRGPVPRDALSLVYAAAPRRLRALVSARRQQLVAPWLTPHGIERLVRALGADEAGWPSRWDRSVLYWHRTRAFAAIDDVLRHLGEELGVQVDNPLLSPMVLSVLANDGGPTGYPTRDDAMRRLFGDVLPAATITRGSKASFGSALWGPRTREFARSWNGDGVDTADVDVEGLRREWLAPEASFMTALLLQRAWLAANRPS